MAAGARLNVINAPQPLSIRAVDGIDLLEPVEAVLEELQDSLRGIGGDGGQRQRAGCRCARLTIDGARPDSRVGLRGSGLKSLINRRQTPPAVGLRDMLDTP